MRLPDKRLDRKLNFGCGAALGFFLAFLGALEAGYEATPAVTIASLVAIALGLITLRFGTRLLEKILKWLP